MKFSVEQDDDIVIFTLKENRLDSAKAGDIKAEFLILCQPTVGAFIIDMTSVEYCDSAGLGAFLLAHRQLKEHGAPVILVGVGEQIMRLLSLSQIAGLFDYYDTVQEALDDLQQFDDDDFSDDNF